MYVQSFLQTNRATMFVCAGSVVADGMSRVAYSLSMLIIYSPASVPFLTRFILQHPSLFPPTPLCRLPWVKTIHLP